MRVVWLSGLVDRPYEFLYVRTIPLSGCMYRRSRYSLPLCLEVLYAWG